MALALSPHLSRLSAEPWKGIEFEYGGLPIEPHGTGLAGLAGVGYMTGQRLVVRRKATGFDRIAFSYGYLGDFERPDMTNRFRRLARGNYHDLIFEKNLRRVTLSWQSTKFGGRNVVSVGSVFRLPKSSLARLEYYYRANFTSASGFNAGAEKALSQRITIGGGYLSVDRNFGPLNADAFWDGRKAYVSGGIKLGRGVALSGLYNRAVGNHYRPTMTSFVTAGIQYDLLSHWNL